ncbi:dGTP triphosphohydrolase [Nitrosarchaeum sp.]|uniref:dGTP triphosphohydrolase n=1 Tax=Nitrosarchaeum sp. TaxID=2026886 RepID=UPI00247D7658|nr:dNTP triphosphohydrolase [Nitrosarchaeum sp.]MCV0411389.1 dNTP triphosphohydrolase [Nitrosarchaeum sp.]
MSLKSCSSYDPTETEFFYHDISNIRTNDSRSMFEKDRSKIIHSTAFRRLQGKTQVFSPGHADFFRTRLTHCLEAAQIGKGLALNHKVADPDLVELACLSHDIGHPAFGHAGEHKLQELMKDCGGFEGNAQNLRILNFLESKYEKCRGLNFTRASIDSILKYSDNYSSVKEKNPAQWKFFYDDDQPLVDWAKSGAPSKDDKSIECQIMNWSDDIAYSTHDLEDGIKSGMISSDKLDQLEPEIRKKLSAENKWNEDIWSDVKNVIKTLTALPKTPHHKKAKRIELIAQLIHEFIAETKVIPRPNSSSFASRYHYTLEIDPKIKIKCNMLKELVWSMILDDPRVATLEKKGQLIVSELFDIFLEEDNWTNKMFPTDFREILNDGKTSRERVICDYIAGMTDSYALRLYSRLTESDIHSIFELL